MMFSVEMEFEIMRVPIDKNDDRMKKKWIEKCFIT